jgi:SMI1/KNR4 family protein SUKH-1
VDSDLSESVAALRQAFEKAGQTPKLGQASPELLDRLKEKLRLPRRYRSFLKACDPQDVEIATPTERVCLIAANDIEREQRGYALNGNGELIGSPLESGWRPEWIIIAHSGLLGDPYFLDVSRADAEGDCPVYTAMSGTDAWQPKLCASTFATFVRILAINLEVARDFDIDDYEPDNERVFREAVAPRIREYDPAAVKAGHWT